MIPTKVQPQHRERPAYVYIRQSTLAQVRHHQESTERQYALREKALALDWPAEKIRILDRDLGLSGAQSTDREDFKTLVADVSMGRVGAIFALEASRLARSNVDWHRLIEICGLTQTLVIDEDGCYDPGDFNDALLLGLKATIAQAELHFIRARLQGGKLNKAKKGELRFPLPVGLCYDAEGQTVLDPDSEVQGAVQLVFRVFRETGSAYAVVQFFAKHGLRFPKRAYGGIWAGQLIWGRLSHARVLGLLKNPAYAGVYTFGRYQSHREISAGGEIRIQTKPVPRERWRVVLHDHHEGYLSRPEFERNQLRVARNRTNAETTVLSGPAREGLALLQGLLLCGRCGRRLSVRYKGNGGLYPMYECNHLRRDGRSTTACMMIRCDLLDAPVSERVLCVLQPAQIEVATEALRQLEERDRGVSRQWQMRIERAEYEVQLAERRYSEVDPANRLVASTLEKRWNDALLRLDELRAQLAEVQRKEAVTLSAEQRATVLSLAQDLPRLWNAPSTEPKDKKRILRLLIQDITVERTAEAKVTVLHIRWQGGATEDLHVTRPPSAADQVRYSEEIVERVRILARSMSDEQIAENLHRAGYRPTKGEAFNASMVCWIRYRHRIPAPPSRRPGELSVQELAERLGVRPGVIYYWIARGRLPARRQNDGSPYWIALQQGQEEELRSYVRSSTRIQNPRSKSQTLL
jgi:DNA invertase Pin-like site-specific DNA recombinase